MYGEIVKIVIGALAKGIEYAVKNAEWGKVKRVAEILAPDKPMLAEMVKQIEDAKTYMELKDRFEPEPKGDE